MTTLVVKLTPLEAKQFARAADEAKLTHEQLALEAVRMFLRGVKAERKASR